MTKYIAHVSHELEDGFGRVSHEKFDTFNEAEAWLRYQMDGTSDHTSYEFGISRSDAQIDLNSQCGLGVLVLKFAELK